MKHVRTGLIVVIMSLALSGCVDQPELRFADWVFPVPEGTPVKEYAPIGLEERTEIAYELVEDLVIGGDPTDPNTAFYRPIAVVAADNGNIFVVDNGNTRVQMFGPDGEFLKTLGQRGQGPGEFQMPMAATIAGGRLIVVDMQNSRFSVWTDEGEYVADHATPMGFSTNRIGGLSDGRIVVVSTEIDLGSMSDGSAILSAMPTTTLVLSTYSAEGEQLVRFVETTNPPMPSPMEFMNDMRARIQFMIDMGEVPRPAFAVGTEQIVYVTPSSEYQVSAMTPEGEMAWALRVAWPRRPYLESRKELRVSAFARDDPEIEVDDFEWPELDDAISGTLRSDGRGRLYVFPLVERAVADGSTEIEESEERPQGRPVDVYSPDGELIVAGLATGTWSYARGDYVYQLAGDPDSDETRVIRYRLVLNPK